MIRPSRFVGDPGLPAVLAPFGLTVSAFKALVAKGEAPVAVYPYPKNARWDRRVLTAWLRQFVKAQAIKAEVVT